MAGDEAGKVRVVVEERLYRRDRRFSHPQPAPQPHSLKTIHPRPQQYGHANAGRKDHVAAWMVITRLIMCFTPQLTPTSFTAANGQDDPQTADTHPHDGS